MGKEKNFWVGRAKVLDGFVNADSSVVIQHSRSPLYGSVSDATPEDKKQVSITEFKNCKESFMNDRSSITTEAALIMTVGFAGILFPHQADKLAVPLTCAYALAAFAALCCIFNASLEYWVVNCNSDALFLECIDMIDKKSVATPFAFFMLSIVALLLAGAITVFQTAGTIAGILVSVLAGLTFSCGTYHYYALRADLS